MTEREILLRLDGAGEKLCRECAHTLAALGCGKDTAFQRLRSMRTPPCLAAERAAAQLREAAKYRERWAALMDLLDKAAIPTARGNREEWAALVALRRAAKRLEQES